MSDSKHLPVETPDANSPDRIRQNLALPQECKFPLSYSVIETKARQNLGASQYFARYTDRPDSQFPASNCTQSSKRKQANAVPAPNCGTVLTL
jgi:hypothetical protein